MTTEELTMLLARITVLDNRQVDELTIEAWGDVLGDLDYDRCVTAVNNHFRNSTDYLKPGHIVADVTMQLMFERDEFDRASAMTVAFISENDTSIARWLDRETDEFKDCVHRYQAWTDVRHEHPQSDAYRTTYGHLIQLVEPLREAAITRRDEAANYQANVR